MLKTVLQAAIRTTRFLLPPAQQYQPIRVTGLTKSQAEDLLDWLEANGYRDYRLSYTADEGFTVSYSKSR
jgi:hypothetical protein